MRKKLLVLGAGNAQFDIIEMCKEKGFEVHGISYMDTDKGISLLDRFEKINIIDVDSVEDYVKENGIEYLYSIGSDLAMPTVMEVAARCGLTHFVSSETALICSNKHLLRERLGEDFRWNIPHVVCENAEDAKDFSFFPAMVKPVDSQGQRGVFKANDYNDVLANFETAKTHSKSGRVIVEKFISGDEVSVNAYFYNGEMIFFLLSDREVFSNLPGGIVKAHHLPSRYEDTGIENEVRDLVIESAKCLEIHEGPAYFQIIVDKEIPYLIELSPRLDGCHMWRLIHSYCGVNLLEMAITHITGEMIPVPSPIFSANRMHLEFFCVRPGIPFSQSAFAEYINNYRRFYYSDGDEVRKINGYMEKCGYRIFSSPEKIGLIGGSGFIGRKFIEMYGDSYELKDLSRKGGLPEYSAEAIEDGLRGCDSVVILAAKKVNSKEKQSYMLYEDNVRVVENTLIACNKLGIKNIVYLSTRCVYSNNTQSPIHESSEIAPVNYYGISKYVGDMVCRYYSENYNMNIKILRLSQVLGLGDDNGYMFANFLQKAQAKETLPVWGNGIERRDYIYVKDVCRGIESALLGYERSGIYNLASGVGVSNPELARAICGAFGNKDNYELLTDKPEDKTVAYFDTELIKRDFGFVCSFTIDSMMQDMAKEV